MGPATAAGASEASRTRPRSASTRPRISAPTARAGRSRPTTIGWPRRRARSVTMARRAGTSTPRSATTTGWTVSRAPSCGSSSGTSTHGPLARLYRTRLAGTGVEMPEDDPEGESAYHLFVVYVDRRDAVRSALAARGVQTAIHYPIPVHLQPAYAGLGHRPGSFPHAERACERVLSLPLFPEMTTEQVEYAALTLA